MLIWKVIAANPGITRQGIWERVEHGIPEGYAFRMYGSYLRTRGRERAEPPARSLVRARGFILSDKLKHMRRGGSVICEGDAADRRYTVARELEYFGNTDAIDVSGSKAAEHMAVADALRVAEKWLAGADLNRPRTRNGARPPVLGPPNRKVYDALMVVVQALRAKGSD